MSLPIDKPFIPARTDRIFGWGPANQFLDFVYVDCDIYDVISMVQLLLILQLQINLAVFNYDGDDDDDHDSIFILG